MEKKEKKRSPNNVFSEQFLLRVTPPLPAGLQTYKLYFFRLLKSGRRMFKMHLSVRTETYKYNIPLSTIYNDCPVPQSTKQRCSLHLYWVAASTVKHLQILLHIVLVTNSGSLLLVYCSLLSVITIRFSNTC